MLVHFDPPRSCLHDGGSICLVPPGSVLPVVSVREDQFIGPPDRIRGYRIPRDTGRGLVWLTSLGPYSDGQTGTVLLSLCNKPGLGQRRK